MQTNQRSGFNSIAAALVALAALILIAVLLSVAMEAGGWMLLALIVGFVIVAALVVWLSSFVVRQRVLWIDAQVKAQDSRNNFLLNMARVGLLPDERGVFKPIHQPQIAAPVPKKEVAPTDPRKPLLIELCLLTIRSDKYGPSSKRLMTADDAQEISKARGGAFADRNRWAEASRYAQDYYLVYEKRGGTEQGLMVDEKRVGGSTISDLISVLMRNPVLDDAVNALPGVER